MAFLGACASGDYSPGPARATTTTTLAQEVTVRGMVGTFSASARVIILAQPAGGFVNVTLPVQVQVERASGAPATVGDLTPGANVEVTGRLGAPGTLVGTRVVLL